MELLLTWVGVLSLAALCISGVTLHLQRKAGSSYDVGQRVHALESDLNDLYDRVEHWQRRDRTRRLREAGPIEQIQPPGPPRGTPEYKHELRKRVRGNGGQA